MHRPKRLLVTQLSVSDLEVAFQERADRWPAAHGDTAAGGGGSVIVDPPLHHGDVDSAHATSSCPRAASRLQQQHSASLRALDAASTRHSSGDRPSTANVPADVIVPPADGPTAHFAPTMVAPPPPVIVSDPQTHQHLVHSAHTNGTDEGPASSWSNHPSPAIALPPPRFTPGADASRGAFAEPMAAGVGDGLEVSIPLLREGSTELPFNSCSPSRRTPSRAPESAPCLHLPSMPAVVADVISFSVPMVHQQQRLHNHVQMGGCIETPAGAAQDLSLDDSIGPDAREAAAAAATESFSMRESYFPDYAVDATRAGSGTGLSVTPAAMASATPLLPSHVRHLSRDAPAGTTATGRNPVTTSSVPQRLSSVIPTGAATSHWDTEYTGPGGGAQPQLAALPAPYVVPFPGLREVRLSAQTLRVRMRDRGLLHDDFADDVACHEMLRRPNARRRGQPRDGAALSPERDSGAAAAAGSVAASVTGPPKFRLSVWRYSPPRRVALPTPLPTVAAAALLPAADVSADRRRGDAVGAASTAAAPLDQPPGDLAVPTRWSSPDYAMILRRWSATPDAAASAAVNGLSPFPRRASYAAATDIFAPEATSATQRLAASVSSLVPRSTLAPNEVDEEVAQFVFGHTAVLEAEPVRPQGGPGTAADGGRAPTPGAVPCDETAVVLTPSAASRRVALAPLTSASPVTAAAADASDGRTAIAFATSAAASSRGPSRSQLPSYAESVALVASPPMAARQYFGHGRSKPRPHGACTAPGAALSIGGGDTSAAALPSSVRASRMSFVPREVLQMALSFLPTGDLAVASQTCAAWFLMADPWVFLEHYGWVPLGPLSRARSVKLRLAAADAEVVGDLFSTLQHKCVSLQLEFVGGVPAWAAPTPNSSVAIASGGSPSDFALATQRRGAAATTDATLGVPAASAPSSPDRAGGAGTPPTGISPIGAASVVALRALVRIEILRPTLQDLAAVAALCRPLVPSARRLAELTLNRACFAATMSPQAAAALDGFPAQRLVLVRVNTLLPRAVRLLLDQAGFPSIRMDRCVVLSQSDAPFSQCNAMMQQPQTPYHARGAFATGAPPTYRDPVSSYTLRQDTSSNEEDEDDVTLLVSGLVYPFECGRAVPVVASGRLSPPATDSRPLYATWQPPPPYASPAPVSTASCDVFQHESGSWITGGAVGAITASAASAALTMLVPDYAVPTSIKPLRPTAAMPFPAQRLRRAFRQLVARGRGGRGLSSRLAMSQNIAAGFGAAGSDDDFFPNGAVGSRSGFASVAPSADDMTTSVSDLALSVELSATPFMAPPLHLGASHGLAAAAAISATGVGGNNTGPPVPQPSAIPPSAMPTATTSTAQPLLYEPLHGPLACAPTTSGCHHPGNGPAHQPQPPCLQCLVHERLCPRHAALVMPLAMLPPARVGVGFPCR